MRGPKGAVHTWLSCDPGPAISPLKLPDLCLPLKTYLEPPGGGAGQISQDRHSETLTTPSIHDFQTAGKGVHSRTGSMGGGGRMRPKHRLPPLSPPLNRVQLVKGVQWLEERTGRDSSLSMALSVKSLAEQHRRCWCGSLALPMAQWPSRKSVWCLHPPRRVSEHSQAAITARPKPGVQRPPHREDLL